MRSTLVALSVLTATSLVAQQPDSTAHDSLHLATLQRQALAADPRLRQLDLQSRQSELRQRTLSAERFPTLSGDAQAQYQSDVPRVPFSVPGGDPTISPPNDTYDASFRVQQRILDPTLAPRRDVERAQLAESQARVHTALFALRQEVNESFFSAALLQERAAEIAATIEDLEGRLRDVTARVQEGTALPGEAAVVEASLLERRQDEAAVHADRRAALAVLAQLTRTEIADRVALVLPPLDDAATAARSALADVRARPEYRQFAETRERLRVQQNAAAAQHRPRLSAFARAGYGKPGLDFLSEEFDAYWLGGLRIEWTPWNWGSTRREQEVLALQQQIVTADEAAFTESLRRGIERDLAALDRLDSSLVLDERIIALRERIEGETRLRFDEGVVTAADYLDRRTDVLEARLGRITHRVERARTQARILTALGL
ncbi:MAG TPA: TolC family protein, partial [Gemmatimonadaceae bacterium]|nr:TolC family protein [Gemmatimonadaceae bacterium]